MTGQREAAMLAAIVMVTGIKDAHLETEITTVAASSIRHGETWSSSFRIKIQGVSYLVTMAPAPADQVGEATTDGER